MARTLPPSASVAQPRDGAKLFAPSAERNTEALLALLHDHAPQSGTALEIASGTGQHISAFAKALPDLFWHPTDVDRSRVASIDAYVSEAGLANLAPAVLLNATSIGWGKDQHPKDLITLANLLHLISDAEAATLIVQATVALAPDGILVLYGPFKRGGQLTSAGDQKFDSELRNADPSIGYKDDLDIARELRDAGMIQITTIDMPANNLAFIARKS